MIDTLIYWHDAVVVVVTNTRAVSLEVLRNSFRVLYTHFLLGNINFQ